MSEHLKFALSYWHTMCVGGAKSRLWLQIVADIITENLYTSQCVESGALGVAILASVGSGYYGTVAQANEKND